MDCSHTLNHLDFQCLGVRWAYHASFSIYAIFYDGTLKGPSSISSHIATSSVWQHHGGIWWLWGNIRWLLRDGISTCSWGQDGETGIGWKILGKIDCLKQIRIHPNSMHTGAPCPPVCPPKISTRICVLREWDRYDPDAEWQFTNMTPKQKECPS